MPLGRLAIIAPGLLGASVARAAHARGVADSIAIWARRPGVRREIAKQPWCDAAPAGLPAAVKDADLVVIAAPVDAIPVLAGRIASSLKKSAVVTDVGSVKQDIVAKCQKALKGRAGFVGSHPMAGSEKTGWQHADATLFEDRTCFVTPLADAPSRAHRLVATFWKDLGGRVVNVDPELHDEIVAHVSHLPQVLASALCSFLAGQDPAWGALAGRGLRDTTRIAGSDPELWRPILQGNQREVLAALRGFQAELAGLERAVAGGDWDAVAALMARGKKYRDRLG